MIEALKDQNVIAGTRKVSRAVEADQVSMVYLADDCDLFIKNKIRALCEEKGVRVTLARSMKELGSSCGLDVGTAAAAVLNN